MVFCSLLRNEVTTRPRSVSTWTQHCLKWAWRSWVSGHCFQMLPCNCECFLNSNGKTMCFHLKPCCNRRITFCFKCIFLKNPHTCQLSKGLVSVCLPTLSSITKTQLLCLTSINLPLLPGSYYTTGEEFSGEVMMINAVQSWQRATSKPKKTFITNPKQFLS